jgi:transcriptional regulator with XRE-family HTH domain
MRIANADQARVLGEISRARRTAGLSNADVGRASHMSRSMVARIQAGSRRASVVELAAIGAAVGLDIRMQAYVAGDPLRDAGQLRVLDRFRAQLHASLQVRTEVPLPIDGDRRAWDAVVAGPGWHAAVEIETVLDDVQALERRLALKARDGGMTVVILVVADTPRNRRILAGVPTAFAWLGRDVRGTFRALRRAEPPPQSALLLV